MGKHKRVLSGLRVVEAGRLRKCYHHKNHQITKGEACLEVKEAMSWKGYCVECARTMLNNGKGELDALLAKLPASDAPSAS